jgi:hypothetical protein
MTSILLLHLDGSFRKRFPFETRLIRAVSPASRFPPPLGASRGLRASDRTLSTDQGVSDLDKC